MLGVLSKERALELSESKKLDLIEVAPQASPPTCRIMDYGKWKYESKKKKASSRKKQNVAVTKELMLRPHIDKHDLETKLRHGRRFLEDGNKVKINIRFLGRERIYRDKGLDLIQRISEILQDIAKPEMEPKSEGRFLFCIFAPFKGPKQASKTAFSSQKPQPQGTPNKEGAKEGNSESPLKKSLKDLKNKVLNNSKDSSKSESS